METWFKVEKVHFLTNFQNYVIPQLIDGFLCSTPEMKARDAYVPFLVYKSLNKCEILDFLDIFSKINMRGDFFLNIDCFIFSSKFASRNIHDFGNYILF